MRELLNVQIEGMPILAVAVLSLCDIASGYVKARMAGEVKSRKMYEGLMHKAAYFMLIVLAVIVQVMQCYFEIWPDFPSVTAVCILICATEIISNLENICAINPDIAEYDLIKKIIGGSENESEH